MSAHKTFGFGYLKKTIWPILPEEVKRVLFLSLILFLVCFNYSILRCMKDTVVITASSAAVIPFIKVWSLLPMAVILTMGYAFLSNRFSHEKVFYIIVSSFLSFFMLFAFVLYPNSESFHLVRFPQFLRTILPKGLGGFVYMVEYWSFTLFYTIAELWSNIVLSVLTWGFINQITKLNEASRFYAVLGVASNLAAVAAGLTANFLNSIDTKKTWEQTLQEMVLLIVILGLVSMFLYSRINGLLSSANKGKAKDDGERVRFSLKDSFIEIGKSKHLLSLAIIVVSYFFVINTVEVVWKEQLRLLYPSPMDFNRYMNSLTAAIGIISTMMAIFMAEFIHRLGWTKTALITPMVMLVTSLLFFSFLIFEGDLIGLTQLLGTTPLFIAVFIGGVQNCLSKSAKYSIFDGTKEMAFIPLSRMAQLKGKAAIDGVGSRLGKSGGSLVHQGIILTFGGLAGCIPYVAIALILVIILWIMATNRLGLILDQSFFHSGLKTETIFQGEPASPIIPEEPVSQVSA